MSALAAAIVCNLLVASLGVEAQQRGTIPRIAVLWNSSPPLVAPLRDAFRDGLRELGYVEAQNIAIEHRYGEDKPERLRQLASELVRLRPAVIVAQGTPSALAARGATSTIPIVMTTAGDPVGSGLVSNLARPDGNVTGLTNLAAELSSKRLQMLKEARPMLSRVAVLWDSTGPAPPADPYGRKATEEAGRSLGLKLQILAVRGLSDFPEVFESAVKAGAEAVVVLPSPILARHRKSLVELAAKHRLPAMYQASEFADAGGLMAYGPSNAALYHRAAYYVDRLLKGAKPADLPVEQPTTFELVINLKTARALGLTIPPSLLLRADQVIE